MHDNVPPHLANVILAGLGQACRTMQKCAYSTYSIRQMSMPKPVCPNLATATPPRPPGAQRAHRQHAGLLELDAQPSAARIRPSEGAARKVSAVDTASVRRAYIPETYAASGPNREPGGS
jgi:hypothetical protein